MIKIMNLDDKIKYWKQEAIECLDVSGGKKPKNTTKEHAEYLLKACEELEQRLETRPHETIVNCTYQKKDDKLIEILTPLGTDIDDPTGEYTDLFAYLYDNISPLLRQ